MQGCSWGPVEARLELQQPTPHQGGCSPQSLLRRSYFGFGTRRMDARGAEIVACSPSKFGTAFEDALMKAWPLIYEAVVDPSVEPFVKANGESAYWYYGKRPEMNGLMQKAMSGVSVPFMKAVLDDYDGFQGVTRLVDVGGSAGECLKMIMDRYPNVREGINFDLPDVVAKAPTITGVTHVGGDMFKSIPNGDVIFMKWILTSFTDSECKLILENCYEALPAGGKLISCEPVVPKKSDDSHRTRALLENDIFMMTSTKGKNRTEEEFRQLGHSAGFSDFRPIYIDYFFTVFEFQK